MAWGRAQGLKVHKFKRNAELPRVRKVLGILRGLQPDVLVDVGTGRGTFLWPLLDSFPELDVTAVDQDAIRARDLRAVRDGGVAWLEALQADARSLPIDADSADVVTLLEVLEHMERPGEAAAEAVRVARRHVIASVPSKEDDNPEHIHLFDADALTRMFEDAGAARVSIDYVRGHIVALARVN